MRARPRTGRTPAARPGTSPSRPPPSRPTAATRSACAPSISLATSKRPRAAPSRSTRRLPDTAVDSEPSNPTNDQDPTFAFTGGPGGVTFECRLDGRLVGRLRLAEGLHRARGRLAHLRRARAGRRRELRPDARVAHLDDRPDRTELRDRVPGERWLLQRRRLEQPVRHRLGRRRARPRRGLAPARVRLALLERDCVRGRFRELAHRDRHGDLVARVCGDELPGRRRLLDPRPRDRCRRQRRDRVVAHLHGRHGAAGDDDRHLAEDAGVEHATPASRSRPTSLARRSSAGSTAEPGRLARVQGTTPRSAKARTRSRSVPRTSAGTSTPPPPRISGSSTRSRRSRPWTTPASTSRARSTSIPVPPTPAAAASTSVGFERSPAGAGSWSSIAAAWDTTGVPNALYDLRVIATDFAGNSSSTPALTGRWVDNLNPIVSIVDPGPVSGTVTVDAERGRRALGRQAGRAPGLRRRRLGRARHRHDRAVSGLVGDRVLPGRHVRRPRDRDGLHRQRRDVLGRLGASSTTPTRPSPSRRRSTSASSTQPTPTRSRSSPTPRTSAAASTRSSSSSAPPVAPPASAPARSAPTTPARTRPPGRSPAPTASTT